MLGCARYGYHKKHVRTHYFELVFLHLVQSACDVLRSNASGAQNVDTVVFMLGWAWCRNHKSVPGHVMMNLCFCIRWDLRVLYCILVHWGHKMSMHYFSCLSGVGTDSTKSASRDVFASSAICGHVVRSGASGVRNVDTLFFMLRWARYEYHKKHVGTHYVVFVFFASCVICGSCSMFWCV
jgi:hypothetical protein